MEAAHCVAAFPVRARSIFQECIRIVIERAGAQNSPNEWLQSIEQENPHRHAPFYRRIADDQPGSVIIREALPRTGQRYNGLLRLARSVSSHAQVIIEIKDFGRANGARPDRQPTRCPRAPGGGASLMMPHPLLKGVGNPLLQRWLGDHLTHFSANVDEGLRDLRADAG